MDHSWKFQPFPHRLKDSHINHSLRDGSVSLANISHSQLEDLQPQRFDYEADLSHLPQGMEMLQGIYFNLIFHLSSINQLLIYLTNWLIVAINLSIIF